MHSANCPQDAFISLTSPLHLSPISLRSVRATERAGSCGREYRAVIDALPYWRRTRPKDGERERERAGKPRPTQGHLRFVRSLCLIRVTSAFVRSFVGSLRRLRRNARSPSVVRVVRLRPRPWVRRIARRGVCVWLASHPSLQVLTAQRNRTDAVGREQENHGKPEVRSSVERNLQAASSSWEDFSSLSVKLAGDAHVVRRHAPAPRSVTVARVRRPSLHIWQMAVRPGLERQR